MTIPKEYLKQLDLRDGSLVFIEKEGEELVVVPKRKVAVGNVTPSFAKMVDEFVRDHEDVLRELAKR
ncbi:MAG: hypothetical protein HYW64_01770 [Candidatus Levybacteria bacterium]|nr:hypothetical protein [Candidatus Levybacteria bacterium]